jgi:hypothetical protein
MNRRLFIQTAALSGTLAVACGPITQAQIVPTATPLPKPQPEQLILTYSIDRNHGHVLNLSALDVIKILRKTHVGQPTTHDIIGSSSHSHSVTFTEEQLFLLLSEGAVEVASTVGSSHSHKISVKLDIAIPTAEAEGLNQD